MNQPQHNTIVNFIWSIADDVLRVYIPEGNIEILYCLLQC
jgi:hypothetical protein